MPKEFTPISRALYCRPKSPRRWRKGNPDEAVTRATNEKTAMMYFLNDAQSKGRISLKRWVEVGKRRGIPTFNDAAADVPPVFRLSEYNKLGFDLVTFSGGKALRGPQCSGLLLGGKDLI